MSDLAQGPLVLADEVVAQQHRERLVADVGAGAGRRVRYEGGFYGQSGDGQQYPEGITLEHLLGLLRALPDGITEFGCHPGDGSRDVESMYLTERADELRVLQDGRVMAEIRQQGIELCSFRALS